MGRFGWVTGRAEAPRTAIPLAHRGKSLADDLARTRYCKPLSSLVRAIALRFSRCSEDLSGRTTAWWTDSALWWVVQGGFALAWQRS